MFHLGDNTPLANILVFAAAAGIGTGAWFLFSSLGGLLSAKLKNPRWLDAKSVWLDKDCR
jgi:hypothetical protein